MSTCPIGMGKEVGVSAKVSVFTFYCYIITYKLSSLIQHIHYFTMSVNQESEQVLGGSSASEPYRLQSSCCQG